MNFFEYQEQARRQSRWLVVLFILAVLIIIAVIDVAILVAFGFMNIEEQQIVISFQTQKANLPVLLGGAVVTLSLIHI